MNREFVNVWVLNYELKLMREELELANVAPLPRAIIKGWSPNLVVDCLVISSDLDLLGCQPLHDLYYEKRSDLTTKPIVKPGITPRDVLLGYRHFLTASLKGDRPGLNGSATGSAPAVDDVPEDAG